ncbi:MAG TPA: hypothetical protein VL096_07045, partial [Pirellulaceae bacterium]|nr:hypothetical protein [Pirellulaceae bacterium]
ERGLGQVTGNDTPIHVGDEIARRKLQGAFLAPMDWADYFVWVQPDNFRPLVYSHVHLLEPATWNDYQQLSAGSADWLAIADRHQLKYLVLSRARQRQLIGSVLKNPARARVLYQDQKSVLVELLPPAVVQR